MWIIKVNNHYCFYLPYFVFCHFVFFHFRRVRVTIVKKIGFVRSLLPFPFLPLVFFLWDRYIEENRSYYPLSFPKWRIIYRMTMGCFFLDMSSQQVSHVSNFFFFLVFVFAILITSVSTHGRSVGRIDASISTSGCDLHLFERASEREWERKHLVWSLSERFSIDISLNTWTHHHHHQGLLNGINTNENVNVTKKHSFAIFHHRFARLLLLLLLYFKCMLEIKS